MTTDEIFTSTKDRFRIISPWPKMNCSVGDIINCTDKSDIDHCEKYPLLYKRISWHEERTLEFIKSVRYVKVTKYVGYWRVGDVVPVAGIGFAKNLSHCKDGTLIYYLDNLTHPHSVDHIEYATVEEYKEWKEKESNPK